jgi:hypothetical protein
MLTVGLSCVVSTGRQVCLTTPPDELITLGIQRSPNQKWMQNLSKTKLNQNWFLTLK